MTQPDDLVPAHRATSLSEAELVRSLLEGAGLFAIIPDRNTPLPGVDLTPVDGEYSGIGSEVLVRAGDLERAKELITAARAAGEQGTDEEADG